MNDIDRKKMTFSQREGYEALPSLPRKDELPIKLKNKLWHFFSTTFTARKQNHIHSWHEINSSFQNFFTHYTLNNTNNGHESINNESIYINTKNLILNAQFNKTMTFLELFLKDDRFWQTKSQIERMFTDHHPNWRILYEKDETEFCYLTTDQEVDTLKKSYEALKTNGYKGAQTHLIRATQQFKDGKWADSIRESIHAVEAVCKKISGDDNATLGKAIAKIEKKHPINPQLKEAMGKLYNYTNGEHGIRHAHIDFDANCDQADAQFMLGACASFISYLCQKAEIA
jgi:hypothetical protein